MKIASKIILCVLCIGIATLGVHAGGKPGRGELYYEGEVVKTLVPPAAMTQVGTEDFYVVFENDVAPMPRQRPVIETAPGDKDYRGGKWAFQKVTWDGAELDGMAPYELKSVLDVLVAHAAQYINIIRVPENDFKCPVQK